ncbi:MAG: GNAT family N-acetyltransferase [Clostridium argentinense]|uniref:GNAT family N-acetyltransferase n=1 Tax=Clostridium faecium TaxID=2762223 RepID=A0ABR8YQA2_9CLOT|nr:MULTISPECIES: GNAT family N-acetyltransferase [Clostridium]MBD8046386.1 GNAT family N-acetyltransferase [Clostridium faecium]MBS5825196.1 GNAT family N-acetyltransferase [Clostridium argentinense]MDU1350406.1 GNAT family N-acetyltransferase [Clostridium argentinense]
MDIVLKIRRKDHIVTFWEKTQDEEIKKLFPFSIESLEESLRLFDESLKKDALSYGKVIYFEEKYVGDIWCYSIDESNEKMSMLSFVIFEKELWGKGIATEATKTFVKEVFNKFDIEKLQHLHIPIIMNQ